MPEFSWKRDLNIVVWRDTILHNLLRAFCAGIVWAVFVLVVSPAGATEGTDGGMPLGLVLLYPLLWPMGYVIAFLPIGMVCGMLSRVGVPFVGLVAIVVSVFIAVGDPLVWMLKRIKPPLVLVEDPGFFDLHIIVFVVDDEKKRARQERAAGSLRGLQQKLR